MKKEKIFCDYCGNESVIETFGLDDEIEYCPLCGEHIEDRDDFDEEKEDLDWSD